MTEPLSPAAQAVYDAWYEAIDAYSEQDPDGDEFWHDVATNTLEDLADEHGQWLPQYQPTPEATND